MEKEIWSIGNHKSEIVSNLPSRSTMQGANRRDTEYYGGFLIAESVKPETAELICKLFNDSQINQ